LWASQKLVTVVTLKYLEKSMRDQSDFISIKKSEAPTEEEAREASSPTTSSARLVTLAYQNQALAKLVAKNPHAPSSLLAQLAAPGEKIPMMFNPPFRSLRPTPWTDPDDYEWLVEHDTRREIAKNPNTPPKTLLTLACHFPQEVSQNPALPVALLEAPDALYQIDLTALILMLDKPQFSHLTAQVAKNIGPKTRERLLQAPETPKKLRTQLAELAKTPE
jgi:hypothetical protein